MLRVKPAPIQQDIVRTHLDEPDETPRVPDMVERRAVKCLQKARLVNLSAVHREKHEPVIA